MMKVLAGVFLTGVLFSPIPTIAETPSRKVNFYHDVMPVLSKAGCNLGTCHGNQNGKGGFFLSLRGQSPDSDYRSLTRRWDSRRVNLLNPEDSLILKKPLMEVAHEGGKRFAKDSPEYQILKTWIAEGCEKSRGDLPRLTELQVSPKNSILFDDVEPVTLQVQANFADGTSRDVTRLAVYEPAHQTVSVSPNGVVHRHDYGETTINVRFLDQQVPVRVAFLPPRENFSWSGPDTKNPIDDFVFAKLKQHRVNPSPICDDVVFLRRVYLDLTGKLPSGDVAQKFLKDPSAQKRDQLINELLKSDGFADFWALKWSDLLRNEEKVLDRKGVENFHAWIRTSIAQGKPLDQFVRQLITSRGSTYKNPPANYYRAMRDPLTRGETTAQLFLGIRLQCAKCHNHPFDRWTQADYYGWSNLFARIEYKIVENKRKDKNDKHEFNGEQIVLIAKKGEVTNPQTQQPEPPRFLGAGTYSSKASEDRLQQLGDWLTSKENTRFARMQTNRIWYHLMGQGLVDPIDDFRATNPASHPELLDWLADDFVQHGFDLRHTIRLILGSQTYQLSSEPTPQNRGDKNFSHALVQRLSAEQLLDSLSQITGESVAFNGYPPGIAARELPGVRAVRIQEKSPSLGDQFLTQFGKPSRLQSCECERSQETTLDQAFQLVSGRLIDDLLTRENNALSEIMKQRSEPRKWVEILFWETLSRPPSDSEQRAATKLIEESLNRRASFEDLAWSLLNSSEFLFRR